MDKLLSRSRVLMALLAALALIATACGGDDGTTEPADTETEASPTETADAEGTAAPEDGPTVTVGSFNFPESVILANIYEIALDEAGYPTELEADLGARELILPELESGAIDLLPEYVGSALGVGFGGEPTADTQATLEKLQSELESIGAQALEPAPGQDKNVFVVTRSFAEEHGLETVSDLSEVEDSITFGGPPECEQRETCLLGLTEGYGLDNIEFEVIQEGSVRVASLENGQIDLALLFSTDPALESEELVALEDDQGIIPAENIVPVVSSEVLEAYGDEFTSLINSISETITTEVLITLNGRAAEGEDPSAIARSYLEEEGLLQGG